METALIPLGTGRVAIIDAADYERANRYAWHYRERGQHEPCVYRHVLCTDYGYQWHTQTLPAFILGLWPHAPVRFKDGDCLNCTRANLIASDAPQGL
ncbi:MAG: hypothetical protein WBZ01_21450 [Terriglobales bacterium]|jgi:hypothetical protein